MHTAQIFAGEAELERVTAELTRSDERYQSLIAAMSEGVAIRYADGTVTICNAVAEQILGLSAEEMTAGPLVAPRWRTLREDGSDFDPEQHPASMTLHTGIEQRDVVVGIVKQNADLTWISVTATPLIVPGESTPYAALCSITDITERRATAHALAASESAARASADLLTSLLEAATGYAIIGTDVNRTITFFNHGAERLLGYRADELVGRETPTMLHDPDEVAARASELGIPIGPEVFVSEERAGAHEQREWTFIARDGRRIPVGLTVSEVRDETGTPTGFIGIAQDISRRKQDEATLAAFATEQEALRAVATLVASESHPRLVFAAAAEQAAHVLGGISGAVFRLEKGDDVRMVGAWSRPDLPKLPIGDLLDRDAPTATAASLRSGVSESARYETAKAGLTNGPAYPLRSGAAAPIRVDGSLWGLVSVGYGDEAAIEPDVSPRLARFADLVSLAVSGAEAREQLAMIASTDHLTGLSNQRSFSDRLEEEVRRARRHGRPLSLVLIDLDHFKLVNDTHGHDIGNRALIQLAERLTDLRRGGEVLARVGGEEFAWILPETDAIGAQGAAERARVAIAGTPFDGIGHLTISAGFCSLTDAASSRELFRHADLALYWAKGLGRNTTFRYAPETLELLPPDEQARRLEHAKTLAAVRALAAAVDAKDGSTQRHSERVATLAAELARVAGWDAERVASLRDAALVHDVGKIGVPDHLLLKCGGLTDDEFEQIKPHAALGARMVSDLLSPEQVGWIRHHHERFDGLGYPDGLIGTEIPDGARILAAADTWDAMTVSRPYGAPRATEDALEECRRCAGAHLCPEAVRWLGELIASDALDALDD
jgi:diguanylate cyclase (GGDEF)-like protein/PAS domain S-box-containing protein